jgi:hypothetical protein
MLYTGRPSRGGRLAALGVLNVLIACGLYYGTWWLADPELRVRALMHTPLPGVSLDDTAKIFDSMQLKSQSGTSPQAALKALGAEPDARGRTTDAVLFVGTLVGWELLATGAACALAMSAGALLGRVGGAVFRLAGVLLALAGMIAVGWMVYGLWTQYGRFVPGQLRFGIAGIMLIAWIGGLTLRGRAKGLTLLAAIMLILSAAGSVFALKIGVQYDALSPDELPLALTTSLAAVFALHSLWGWILLPLALRIRR